MSFMVGFLREDDCPAGGPAGQDLCDQWPCTWTMMPGLPAPFSAMTRYRFSRLTSLSTIWRIGPAASTMAEPAGLVLKFASGCNSPRPSALVDSARTYGFFGSRPVTEAWRTWIRPWSNRETLVGALPSDFPAAARVRWAVCPATPSGSRLSVPAPSGTAFGTYVIACGACPIGMFATTLLVSVL